MNFKKLTPELVSGLNDAGLTDTTLKIQSLAIPQIKSGGDLFMIAPYKSGKSTALVIGVIQQLKEAFEQVPRAIIMVSTKDEANKLEELFNTIGRYTDLRVFTAFDGGVLQYQKDMIYEGLDVLIGTPRRLNELTKVNGIYFTNVKMFIVDDLNTYPSNKYDPIYQIANKIEKAQLIMTANKWNDSFERLSELIMKNPKTIEVE